MLLLVRKFGKTRQRDCVQRSSLGFRKLSLFIIQVRKTLLQMQRNRIINFVTNPMLRQMFNQVIAVTRRADDVLMENVSRFRSYKGKHKSTGSLVITKQLIIKSCFAAPRFRPLIQVF